MGNAEALAAALEELILAEEDHPKRHPATTVIPQREINRAAKRRERAMVAAKLALAQARQTNG